MRQYLELSQGAPGIENMDAMAAAPTGSSGDRRASQMAQQLKEAADQRTTAGGTGAGANDLMTNATAD